LYLTQDESPWISNIEKWRQAGASTNPGRIIDYETVAQALRD